MYFKYTPYLYLVAALFFLYDAIMRINTGETPYVSFAFVAVAVFMFFFRRWNYRKYTNNRNQK